MGVFAVIVVVIVAVVMSSGDDGDDPETVADASDTTEGEETTTTAQSTTTTTEPRGDVDVFQLAVGDCWDLPESLQEGSAGEDVQEVNTVPVVPCTEEHDMEVYAVFDLDDGPWPGQDVVADEAQNGCLARWQSFVGLDYSESSLDVYKLFPILESWEDMGDREVTCSIYDPAARTSGSLEGAAR